jgi:hypothetical protein
VLRFGLLRGSFGPRSEPVRSIPGSEERCCLPSGRGEAQGRGSRVASASPCCCCCCCCCCSRRRLFMCAHAAASGAACATSPALARAALAAVPAATGAAVAEGASSEVLWRWSGESKKVDTSGLPEDVDMPDVVAIPPCTRGVVGERGDAPPPAARAAADGCAAVAPKSANSVRRALVGGAASAPPRAAPRSRRKGE